MLISKMPLRLSFDYSLKGSSRRSTHNDFKQEAIGKVAILCVSDAAAVKQMQISAKQGPQDMPAGALAAAGRRP